MPFTHPLSCLWLGIASSNAEAVIALGVLAGVVVLLVMLAVTAGVSAVLVQRRRKTGL